MPKNKASLSRYLFACTKDILILYVLNFIKVYTHTHTHSHTHTHIYIYIYIYIRESLNKFPDIFVWALLLIVHTWNSCPLEVISSGFNALVVRFQQLLEGPMENLLCESVNDLRLSLFNLLNCLITTVSELRESAKVTESKVWTIGRLRNCLEAHLGQIVCNKDGVVDWGIVLVEMPLIQFEECWPLTMESLPELP